MLSPTRILHVDDSTLDRELVRDALLREASDFHLIEAASRAEFEAILLRGGFDLVLSDFNILGFEGFEVIKAVHSRYPDVPVILVTGTGSEEIAVQALRTGAADYVIKTPQHIQRLPKTIRAVLERERLRHERAAVFESLRLAEQKYRSLFENAVEGIFQTTESGRYQNANPALARLYGYASPAQLMEELNAHSLYCDPQRRVEFEERIKKNGFVERFISQARRRDGEIIWISENVRLTWSESGDLLYEGTVEDITEHKHVQEALQKANDELEQRVAERTRALREANSRLQHELEERSFIEAELRRAYAEAEGATQAKTEFLSRMSHELRTPLNAILGFAQLLELDELDDNQQECVSQILRGGHHLLELINEILDISRIESGMLAVSAKPVSAPIIIAECLAMVRPLAQESNIELRSEIALHTPLFVRADPRRLKQVLLNLLSNAIKYNRPQGRVEVLYNASASGVATARFSIQDTGLGIPSDKMHRLFAPFERLHTEEVQVEGSGLGLLLAKRLTEAMHGTIGVESSAGKGSTFWVELPLEENTPANKPQATEP